MVDPQAHRELAVDVLRRLREAGFAAYWAGGCVRDQLLGRVPQDYDVATNATPDQICNVFGHRRTLAIGAAFGVVAVRGPRAAGMVEVATFRRDAQYSDGRHPDTVIYSTPEEDAQRRDFTINGLFYDPLSDQVIDYVDGQEDLRRGVVRAIGDPEARFGEDKLRMLRAVRFAATFDFELEAATAASIARTAGTIRVVSPERIADELRKMLVHPARTSAVALLLQTGLLAELLPELQTALTAASQMKSGAAPRGPHDGDAWRHLCAVLDGLAMPSFPLALAALLHVLAEDPRAPGQPITTERRAATVAAAAAISERWRLSNKDQERVCWLLAQQGALCAAAAQPWSRLQPILISEGIDELIALDEAEALAAGGETAKQGAADAAFCRRALEMPPDKLDPAPLLDGHDLVAHGVPKGPIYKWLLEQARDAQLDQQILSREEALALVVRLLATGHSGSADET